MSKTIVMEEFHVTLLARSDLPRSEYSAIRRTLSSRSFPTRLLAAVRGAIEDCPSLTNIQVQLSR